MSNADNIDAIDIVGTPPSFPGSHWPPLPILQAMYQHCQRDYPLEACGLWSTSCEPEQTLWQRHPCKNVSPAHAQKQLFCIDPLALLPLLEAEDRGTLRLRGMYHSHPDAAPVMSQRDRSTLQLGGQPAYPGWDYIIIRSAQQIAQHVGALVALYRWDDEMKCFSCVDTIDGLSATLLTQES